MKCKTLPMMPLALGRYDVAAHVRRDTLGIFTRASIHATGAVKGEPKRVSDMAWESERKEGHTEQLSIRLESQQAGDKWFGLSIYLSDGPERMYACVCV